MNFWVEKGSSKAHYIKQMENSIISTDGNLNVASIKKYKLLKTIGKGFYSK